jgi:hypothetical protein
MYRFDCNCIHTVLQSYLPHTVLPERRQVRKDDIEVCLTGSTLRSLNRQIHAVYGPRREREES